MLTACSLFVSTDGLSSGDDDAASPTNDAPFDAPSDYVSPLTDAGADADATKTPFCAANPGHSLCFDFDESTEIPPVDNQAFAPGAIFVDNGVSVSAPQSLAVIYPSGMGSNESIEKDLPSTSGVLSFKIDLRFTASDLSAGQTIDFSVSVPYGADLSGHIFFIQTYYNGLAVAENVTPSDGGVANYPSVTLVSPVPSDEWLHIEVSIDGTSRDEKISLNGTSLADTQAAVGFPSGVAHVTLSGYGSAQLPAQTTLHIDNVIVDY